jgi:excisionase family DNA binding protein
MSDNANTGSALFVRLAPEESTRLERAVAASGKSKRRLVGEAVREHLTDDGLVVGRAQLHEEPHEVLSVGELAAWLRLDEPAVLAAAEAGELPGRRIGADWRFSRPAIAAWLAAAPQPQP